MGNQINPGNQDNTTPTSNEDLKTGQTNPPGSGKEQNRQDWEKTGQAGGNMPNKQSDKPGSEQPGNTDKTDNANQNQR